jgi:hypothetical protein
MRGFQVGQELGEIAFVFGESYEAADPVALSRPAAAAFHCDAAQFAARGGDGSRASEFRSQNSGVRIQNSESWRQSSEARP